MDWQFWKKCKVGQKREPVRLVIPAEKSQQILRLRDAYQAAPTGSDNEARYLMWAAVAEVFPQVREGSWSLHTKNALKLEVVEDVEC